MSDFFYFFILKEHFKGIQKKKKTHVERIFHKEGTSQGMCLF